MKYLFMVGVFTLLLSACTVSLSPPNQQPLPESTPGTKAEQQEAVAAASSFIALIDRGDYEAIWRDAGPALRDMTNETAFTMTLKLARKAFAIFPGRKPEGVGFNTQVDPSGPTGEYAIVQYVSRSGNLVATESVVMQKEEGRWKIIGYFIKKRAQTGMGK